MEPPILIRFGNVIETGPDFTAMLLKLCNLESQKKDEGLISNDPLRRIDEV